MSVFGPKRKCGPVGGSHYDDRVPLEDDFEAVSASTITLTSRNAAISSEISFLPSPWTVGSSWGPEDNFEYSLDPDAGWYDEAVEANIEDIIEQVANPKPKKRKTHVSVRESLFLFNSFDYSNALSG